MQFFTRHWNLAMLCILIFLVLFVWFGFFVNTQAREGNQANHEAKSQTDRQSGMYPIRNWKWAGHIARMKDNGLIEAQSGRECKISWKNKTSLERWHCGAAGSSLDKDSKRQRKLEDSGGGLFPAVKGHSLECNRTGLGKYWGLCLH